MRVGYKRVSTLLQNTDRQLDGEEFGKVFEDKVSGKDTNRPALQEAIQFVRDGDVFVVHSMDRLARNLDDLRRIVKDLTGKGVKVHFVKENLIFTGDDTPMAELLLNLLGAVAQFERSLINERQREGVQIAKANGAYKGRKREMTDDKVAEIHRRSAAGDTKAQIARDLGISRETLYQYLRVECT